MAQPQLSVRSARARDLAHELARREGRTVAQIVERALEAYRARVGAPRESAAEFYRRLTEGREEDIDLDALLEEHRKPHLGIDL